MTKPKNILLLLLLICTHNNFASASKFHFVKIIDGNPYVIIRDSWVKNRLLTAIINSYYNTDVRNPYKITIDSSNVEFIKGINLDFWDRSSGIKCFTLLGDSNHLKSIIGYAVGDRLVIQQIINNGIGQQKEIVVKKILLHTNRNESFILLKCKPTITDNIWVYAKGNQKNHIISSEYHPLKEVFWGRPPETIIPNFIDQKVNDIVETLIPEHYHMPEKEIAITSIRFYKDNSFHNFYCSVIKIDQMGLGYLIGKLFLFDNGGNIVQNIDDKFTTRIIGITDVNRDGSQELTVFWGSSYGGGLMLLDFDHTYDNEPYLLQIKTSLSTVWD